MNGAQPFGCHALRETAILPYKLKGVHLINRGSWYFTTVGERDVIFPFKLENF